MSHAVEFAQHMMNKNPNQIAVCIISTGIKE